MTIYIPAGVFVIVWRDDDFIGYRITMLFQLVVLDNSSFVMIYVLTYFIYYDKIRIADMVKKKLLDRALREFLSAQAMTLSQPENSLRPKCRNMRSVSHVSLNLISTSSLSTRCVHN